MPHSTSSGGDLIWRPTRMAIYARDSWCCAVCAWRPQRVSILLDYVSRIIQDRAPTRALDGRRITRGLTLDHVVPCSRGGSNGPENLVTMCLACNSAKQARTLREYASEAMRAAKPRLRRPLDRRLGRELCSLLYPGWYEAHQRRKRRSRAGLIQSADSFFSSIPQQRAA